MNNLSKTAIIELLTKMYEKSPEIIFFLNANGKVIDMNPAAKVVVDEKERIGKGLPSIHL